MDVTINWLAILAATIAGTVIAGIWYAKAFGDAWIRLTGVTKKDSEKAGKTPMVILVATNFVTAVALTRSRKYLRCFLSLCSLRDPSRMNLLANSGEEPSSFRR